MEHSSIVETAKIDDQLKDKTGDAVPEELRSQINMLSPAKPVHNQGKIPLPSVCYPGSCRSLRIWLLRGDASPRSGR